MEGATRRRRRPARATQNSNTEDATGHMTTSGKQLSADLVLLLSRPGGVLLGKAAPRVHCGPWKEGRRGGMGGTSPAARRCPHTERPSCHPARQVAVFQVTHFPGAFPGVSFLPQSSDTGQPGWKGHGSSPKWGGGGSQGSVVLRRRGGEQGGPSWPLGTPPAPCKPLAGPTAIPQGPAAQIPVPCGSSPTDRWPPLSRPQGLSTQAAENLLARTGGAGPGPRGHRRLLKHLPPAKVP